MSPRVLVIDPGPRFSVMDVHNGWVKGLRQMGCQVWTLDFAARLQFYEDSFRYDERMACWVNPFDERQNMLLAADGLFAEALKIRPDIVVVISGFFVPIEFPQIVRAMGCKYVYVVTESPYEDDTCTARAGYADLTIVNDSVNLDRYPKGSYYQPHCYDPEVHYPGTGATDYDFSFVGTGYESRQAFFEAVDFGDLKVRIEGNWPIPESSPLRRYITGEVEECTFNSETADLYRASATTANLYRREANQPELSQGWAMGPREVESAACGTFMLRDPRPESDEVLHMLPSFTGPDDFSDKLRWWAGHHAARREATRQARAAIADRTFENAARRLLSTLNP